MEGGGQIGSVQRGRCCEPCLHLRPAHACMSSRLASRGPVGLSAQDNLMVAVLKDGAGVRLRDIGEAPYDCTTLLQALPFEVLAIKLAGALHCCRGSELRRRAGACAHAHCRCVPPSHTKGLSCPALPCLARARLSLTDFGLCKDTDTSAPRSVVGTPAYMAPGNPPDLIWAPHRELVFGGLRGSVGEGGGQEPCLHAL